MTAISDLVINNRYKVLAALSQGAFGQVFRVEDLNEEKKKYITNQN